MDNMHTERMLASNEALLKAYKALDPSDPKFLEKMKALTAMHQQINADNENAITLEVEAKKADVETQQIEAEKTKTKYGFLGDIGKAIGAGVAAGLGFAGIIYSEKHLDRRFDKASKFEESDAYLTTTAKETVREGLRPKRFKLF